MKIRALAGAAVCSLVILAQSFVAGAAEVKVLSAGAMRGVMNELGPRFEQATGHKLVIQFGEVGALKRQIDTGEAFDVAMLTAPLMDDLVKEGKIASGTRTDIARSGLGVIARAGAPKPDISSVDAFKRAMLDAKSFAYAKEGATANHVALLFERLGIAEHMQPKLMPVALASESVAKGEAELGLVIMSAFGSVPGIELIGPLPSELQNYVRFAAGASAAAKEPAGSKALIDFLKAPTAIPVLKAKGMEPSTP